jgi:homoserine dehydrogenase
LSALGRWVARALDSERERLAGKYGIAVAVVGVARARDGFIYDRSGLDLRSVLGLASALVDGLAGAVPVGLRGLLNATAHFILSRMAEGTTYEEALAEAQTAGLAERDPAADVEGHDAVAKVMILSALVFGRQLRPEQVARRGITDIARAQIDQAASRGARLKHVARLEFSAPDGAGDVTARVEPELVPGDDPLASIDGTSNAVVCRANPIGEVTIIGPGAGPQIAGQGVFSDLIAVARSRTSD